MYIHTNLLTTNHEVPGLIPVSTVGIFLEGEDSRGDHGLGRLVEFRFKAPPGTTSSSITTHTPSGQRNCASWASQPQKLVTLLPCPGGMTTKSTKDMWWHWGGGTLLRPVTLSPRYSVTVNHQHVQNYNVLNTNAPNFHSSIQTCQISNPILALFLKDSTFTIHSCL